MEKDTLTLVLNGDVPLEGFVAALQHFNELINALTEDILTKDEPEIEWQIAELSVGSAKTAVRGRPKGDIGSENSPVPRIAKAYGEIGEALKRGDFSNYPDKVVSSTIALTKLINEHIKSIEFLTDDTSYFFSEPFLLPNAMPSGLKLTSIGIITGYVSAISDRNKLRLTIYDSLFNKAVICSLDQNQEELARKIWKKKVSITGLIKRDPLTGRPIEIQEVYDIKINESLPNPLIPTEVRGALPWQIGDEPAEISVRRQRDA